MASKYGNVKGIKWLEEPLGANRGGVALVTFDLIAQSGYVGGTDTLQLGSSSANQAYENGVLQTTALTLATMLQNRRRDGRTVTLSQSMGSPAPGAQAAATNGPLIYAQSVAVSSGNITLNLFSAPVSGSAVTTTTASWDRPCTIAVEYTAVYTGNNPE